MPVASIIAGVVAAGTAIGTSVAGGVDRGEKGAQAEKLMHLNHRYETIAENRGLERQRASDAMNRQQYDMSLADKERNKLQLVETQSTQKGQNAANRMLGTLNNNPAIREHTLSLFRRAA